VNLETIASRPNLRSAWRRVTSALNTNYKAPYRPILEAYELASPGALADLGHRLRDNTYTPQTPLRLYYPKRSGLQRPITHLVIEDQIVLQALANIFAKATYTSRLAYEGRSVFSNYLNPSTSPFAVRQWWIGYTAMLSRFERQYRSGANWVVKFDLAAFYETIAHDLLMRTIAPRRGSRVLVDAASKWLHCWSSPVASSRYSHGIPQGPVASDVLAECFLLPIDVAMSQKHRYVRYVDDIRVFGKSEDEIRQAMVLLDRLCRERGLIPNVDKLGAVKLKTLRHLREIAPRIDTYHNAPRSQQVSESKSWEDVTSSLSPSRRVIVDKTKFRFSIFRAPPSPRVLKLVLRLWPKFPEHTDAFVSFLDQYSSSPLAAAAASAIVRSAYPYDAVKGEQWRLLARLSSITRKRALTDRALRAVRDPATGHGTRLGAMAFLCTLQAQGLGSYSSFLRWAEHPLIQAFTAPYLPLPLNRVAGTAGNLLGRSAPDPSLALMRPLQLGNTDPRGLLPRGRNLNPIAQIAFEEAGLLPPSGRRRRDPLSALLARRFRIQDWPNWRGLLRAEYGHAHSTLLTAETYFDAHYTPWLGLHDSLNEILFRALQSHLNAQAAPGAIQTTQANGDLINYGGLIQNPTFQAAYPALAGLLVDIRTRRNRLPASHPYERRTGARSTPLNRSERDSYRGKLGRVYADFIRASMLLGL